MEEQRAWCYRELKQAIQSETLPAMVVDLDCLERNTRRLAEVASGAEKSLRVASKSIRVPHVLDMIRDWCGDTFGGLMTFSPEETAFLYDRGYSDFILAYPRVNKTKLKQILELHRAGATPRLIVDEPEHLRAIEAVYRQQSTDLKPLPVCVEVDVSYRPGNVAHFGVQRSPIRSLDQFEEFLGRVQDSACVTFAGVMGYEAQQAGVPDNSPYHPIKNYAVRLMKHLSRQSVRRKRREVADVLPNEDSLLFNAGGTGSIDFSVRGECISEVTAGSGFLQSHLFDYYRRNRNEPAFCFGLPITRRPQSDVVTCQSGGFIASGPTDRDKAPRPFLPDSVSTIDQEGFGEVQTPLRLSGDRTLAIGDPVFFRPAKAGEIAERFNEYLLLEDGTIVDRARTYRGHGQCFF